MAETQTSINIPQLIAVAIVGFLALRWFLNKPSSTTPGSASTSNSSRSSTTTNRAIDLQKVDQVSAMFPQLDRRTIAWDLSRNGGNVAATTERVLSSRGLDTPPPSFRPELPPPALTAAQQRNARGQGIDKPSQPDLITRYNLQARVGGKGKEAVPSEEQRRSGNAWSSDKAARAEGLRRRREEMVLEARRKMEARVRGEV
jgi:coupling of ubiquitin conjugation to ER degradation protein 1